MFWDGPSHPPYLTYRGRVLLQSYICAATEECNRAGACAELLLDRKVEPGQLINGVDSQSQFVLHCS
jgi:hypothetical protein